MNKPARVDGNTINSLVESDRIHTLFQPIISIDSRSLVGFEAYSRGMTEDGEISLNSKALFGDAWTAEEHRKLDSHCCRQALLQFNAIGKGREALSLFLNIDVHVIESDDGRAELVKQLDEIELTPQSVVLEVAVQDLENEKALPFLESCRKDGFQISIDKVEREADIFEVLLKFKPDYIKFMPDVWNNPADPAYNVETLSFLAKSCRSLGTIPIAFGVEEEDEALYLLLCDMFYHQGYFYTQQESGKAEGREKDGNGEAGEETPKTENAKEDEDGKGEKSGEAEPAKEDSISGALMSIQRIHAKFNKLHKERIQTRKELLLKRKKQIKRITSKFENMNEGDFDEALTSILINHEEVVSLFVLDASGIQSSLRLARVRTGNNPKKFREVRSKGRDHSLHDYYMYPLMGYDHYVTHPSRSPFIDQDSIIFSFRFFCGVQKWYLLCVEFPSG